jgi:hypothetical protein
MQLRITWTLFFGVGSVSMEIANDTALARIARLATAHGVINLKA